jgi:hypothetical protein
LWVSIHTNYRQNNTKHTFTLYPYVVGSSMNTIGHTLKVEPTPPHMGKEVCPKNLEKPTPQNEGKSNSIKCGTVYDQKTKSGPEGKLSNYRQTCGGESGHRRPKH